MMQPYAEKVIWGIIILVAIMSLRLVTPLLSRVLVDDIIKGGRIELLTTMLLALLGILVVRSVLVYIRSIIFHTVSQKIVIGIRETMYDHLHELPFSFYDHHRIGEIMSRMTGDIESIRNLIASGIITIIEQSINFTGAIIIVFTISPLLGCVLLLMAPVLALVGFRFDRNIRPAFHRIREQNAVLNARTQESIAGVRVVKAFAREDYENEQFQTENHYQRDLGINISRIFSRFYPIVEFIAALTPALLLMVGGALAVKGYITSGSVVAVFGYISSVTVPMRQLSHILNMVAQSITSADRIFYYMDFGSEIREKLDARFPETFTGHIVFDHVDFSYGDEKVLHDISFEVPPGGTLAIMGATGSGKTSIVNLLGRYYECQRGAVRIDGIDVKDMKLKPLRRQIGYIMQETFLFSDSLEGNIAFGNPDATPEQVRKAAEIAQAAEFIDNLDEGMDMIVGERGMGLSGGQKQRVAIARALVVDPKILVLDDATASVDMETEHAIQQGLKEVMAGRTTIIISHRISSVRKADEIIVLEEGRIAERGTHETLMEKKGLYYGIFMDQYRDYESMVRRQVI
ncbi:MAG: ABC transporter ATP-binding protein [Christensenellales bacterium]|jgi:ATP-binding cassette subfamily B multidrug efflux pump